MSSQEAADTDALLAWALKSPGGSAIKRPAPTSGDFARASGMKKMRLAPPAAAPPAAGSASKGTVGSSRKRHVQKGVIPPQQLESSDSEVERRLLPADRSTRNERVRPQVTPEASGVPAQSRQRPPLPRDNTAAAAAPTHALNTAVSSAISELGSTLSKSLETAVVTALGNLDTNMSRYMTTMRTEREVAQEQYTKVLESSLQQFADTVKGSLSRAGNSDSDDENGEEHNAEAKMKKRIELMHEFIKYCTCIEFLDATRGQHLFTTATEDSEMLRESAKFVQVPEDETEDFLQQVVSDRAKRNKGGNTSAARNRGRESKKNMKTIASTVIRGQQRAHDNIRNKIVNSFLSALPVNYALNPASSTSSSQKQQCAKDLCASFRFKFDVSFQDAWRSACIAAIREAHSTAETSAKLLSDEKDCGELPFLPNIEEVLDESSREQPMSLYSLCFVSTKIVKFIQGLAKDKNARMNKSHAPFWVKEILAVNKVLRHESEGFSAACVLENDDTNVSEELRMPVYLGVVRELAVLSKPAVKHLKILRDEF